MLKDISIAGTASYADVGQRLASCKALNFMALIGFRGDGERAQAPRSRSRAKPFPVCEHCERTGRNRDRAAASPARYRDAARIAGAAHEGVDLAEAITVLGVFASTMTDGLGP